MFWLLVTACFSPDPYWLRCHSKWVISVEQKWLASHLLFAVYKTGELWAEVHHTLMLLWARCQKRWIYCWIVLWQGSSVYLCLDGSGPSYPAYPPEICSLWKPKASMVNHLRINNTWLKRPWMHSSTRETRLISTTINDTPHNNITKIKKKMENREINANTKYKTRTVHN